MYKLLNVGNKQFITLTNGDSVMTIPEDPANTDYQAFKQQINEETAQLEDANGVLMTPEQAKQFVSTLP